MLCQIDPRRVNLTLIQAWQYGGVGGRREISFAVRNLANLLDSGSTARVLNLVRVWETAGQADEAEARQWAAAPMFTHPELNRSLIIKHRLRHNEKEAFDRDCFVATKVVLPFSSDDLKSGGRFFFVGQVGFDRMMSEAFGLSPGHRDLRMLRAIDAFPSLDPFLLREQLKRYGFSPAPCYFAISEGDLLRMRRFVETEIAPLVAMSLEGGEMRGRPDALTEMANRVLSPADGDQMTALRQALKLGPHEYEEGLFCWKGFLYYKWVLTSLRREVADVIDEVASMEPAGRMDTAAREAIERGRVILRRKIGQAHSDAMGTVGIYDQAYAQLMDGRPNEFRAFLLNAPHLFSILGDQLGAVQHVVSFWRYRFHRDRHAASVEELLDIFMDFEHSLSGEATARKLVLAA